jgi:hypothetical protein
MIICRDCGHQNEEEDQFCGSCGAFLEFSGEKVQPTVVAQDDDAIDDEGERFLRLKQATATDAATLASGVAENERVASEDAALAAQVAASKVAAEQDRIQKIAEEEAAARLAEVEKQQREAKEKAEAAERELAELQQSREAEALQQRELEAKAASEAQQRLQARVAEAEAKARAEAAEEQRRLQQKLEEEERAAEQARQEAQASAERAKQAEREAEEQRRAAQARLEAAAAAASAAALRMSQENDALAAAEAARLSSEAEAARSRAEAESAAANAAEEIAKSRAEAEQAKAEAQALRSQLQADAARSELDLLKERADRSAQEDAARARQRIEDEEASARQRAKDSAEAAALKAAAEAEASERKAEAELAARNAEAKAAAARAEEERARSAAEAQSAKREREEALRKAAALVAPAKPSAGSSAGGAQPGTAQKPLTKAAASAAKGTLDSAKIDQKKTPADAAGSVAARLPGAQVQRQAPKKSAAADINPGDVVCGSCGVGNVPTRKFCRRCGTSLADAKVAKLGFFARLRARRNRKKIKQAGYRPGSPGRDSNGQKRSIRGFFRGIWWKINSNLLRVGAMLGILAAFGFGVEPIRSKLHLPDVRSAGFDLIKRTITNPPYDPVRAQQATASSGANPSALIDLGNNTTWKAAPNPSGGVGSSFVISFDKPFDLGRVLITSGLAGSDKPGEGFVSQPRPSELRVIFNDEVAEPLTVKVKDTAEPQVLKIKHKEVRSVRFEISGVYPAVGGQGKSVAVTEVEFFQKRKLGDDFETLPKPKISAPGGVGAVSLTDEDLSTAWISSTGVGGGQGFSLIFATPVDIDRLRIAPGRSEAEFQSSPRPHEVQLAFQCQGRCDATKQISFKDKPGFKSVGISATGVTRIDVLVRSVYGEGEGVAFAEVDVARKRPKVN